MLDNLLINSKNYKNKKDCRLCKSSKLSTVFSLKPTPLANDFVKICTKSQNKYPLEINICDNCGHVQLAHVVDSKLLFTNYLYASGTSKVFVRHFKVYAEYIKKLLDTPKNYPLAVDIGSNDGTLLNEFKNIGFNVIGVEPAKNLAEISKKNSIDVINGYFNKEAVKNIISKKGKADVISANNVFAHIDELQNVIKDAYSLLSDEGLLVFEVSYLGSVLDGLLFDTIYHEHYSYLSFTSVVNILSMNGLMIFDIDELSTHGGSLRIYAQRTDTGIRSVSKAVQSMLIKERLAGMNSILFYSKFQKVVDKIKLEFLEFLINAKRNKLRVAAYSAAAKGNTLINFLGIKSDLIHCIADKNIDKQGKFLPGSHIPIVSEKELEKYNPHYVIIMAWNIKDEIIKQLKLNQNLHSKFVTVIPEIIVQ